MTKAILRRTLLACGMLSSLVYVGADVLAAIRYPEYHSFSTQMVSELMANGAPTERLVDPIFLLYGVLLVAFGVGAWMSAGQKGSLRWAAGFLAANGALGLTGPTLFEMNLRRNGAAVAEEDVLHIAATAVLSLLILLAMGIGAFAGGRRFRWFSFAMIGTLLGFAVLAGLESSHIAAGEPTPWLGITERIGIGAYLLWVAILAVSLLRAERRLVQRVAACEHFGDGHRAQSS